MPKEGVVHHNLGTALLRLAQARGKDRALLEEAAKSLREAAKLGGRRAPHFNVRLAEALSALGDRAGAEAALREAFAVNPIDLVLMMARVSSLADIPVQGEPAACKAVDFGCKKNCPQGLTGRMMMVACEIANSECCERLPRRQALSQGLQVREQAAALRDFDTRPRSRIFDQDALGVDRRHGAEQRPDRLAGELQYPAGGGVSRGSWAPKGAINPRPARPISASTRATCSYSLKNSNFVMKNASAYNIGPS